MKKKIVYLIIGIIVSSVTIVALNACIFDEIMVDMMPNPLESVEESLLITKVLNKQKLLLPTNIGLSTIFTIIYTFILRKNTILDKIEKSSKYFFIALLVIPIIISIKIYISYNVIIIC